MRFDRTVTTASATLQRLVAISVVFFLLDTSLRMRRITAALGFGDPIPRLCLNFTHGVARQARTSKAPTMNSTSTPSLDGSTVLRHLCQARYYASIVIDDPAKALIVSMKQSPLHGKVGEMDPAATQFKALVKGELPWMAVLKAEILRQLKHDGIAGGIPEVDETNERDRFLVEKIDEALEAHELLVTAQHLPNATLLSLVAKQNYCSRFVGSLQSAIAVIFRAESIAVKQPVTASLGDGSSRNASVPQPILADQVAQFVTTLHADGEHRVILKLLEGIATTLRGGSFEDGSYVRPIEVCKTWNNKEWFYTLLKGRAKLHGLTGDGSKVLGVWAGTGHGKSHRLRQLAHFRPREILEKCKTSMKNVTPEEQQLMDVPDVSRFVYITYNMEQSLGFDRENPGIAIYLRVLLRSMEVPNIACDVFLSEHSDTLKVINEAKLHVLVCRHFMHENVRHLAIGVDEIRSLVRDSPTHGAIPATTSRLGYIAKILEKNNITCTIVVTSLTEGTFKSESTTPIVELQLPPVSEDAIDFIIPLLLPEDKRTKQNRALIKAASGTHFRSAVVAIQQIAANGEPTPKSVLASVLENIETKLSSDDREMIADYIIASIRRRKLPGPSQQRFVDASGAVAPPFVFAAFDGRWGFKRNDHPGVKLFQVSAFVDATKQLEKCGMYYDQFRAFYELPVVPEEVFVHNSKNSVFFRSLRFPRDIAYEEYDKGSIFQTSAGETKGSSQKKKEKRLHCQIRDGWQPASNRYMLPSVANHPFIDRACVAFDPSGKNRCLVIYQDKINAAGFPKAVSDLNAAATCLKKYLKYDVLCVANVLQATDETTAQRLFTHPYVLVRGSELRQYYGPTFATPIEFLVNRYNFQE